MHYFDRDGLSIDAERWSQLYEDKQYTRVAHDKVGDVLVTTIWQGFDPDGPGVDHELSLSSFADHLIDDAMPIGLAQYLASQGYMGDTPDSDDEAPSISLAEVEGLRAYAAQPGHEHLDALQFAFALACWRGRAAVINSDFELAQNHCTAMGHILARHREVDADITFGAVQLPFRPLVAGLTPPPSIFETAVRDGEEWSIPARYSTEVEALAGHAEIVDSLKAKVQ